MGIISLELQHHDASFRFVFPTNKIAQLLKFFIYFLIAQQVTLSI